MKRIMILLLAVILATTPLSAHAQQRDWWPEQICEDDEYYDFQKIGEWPGEVITNEIAIDPITFRPKVISAQTFSKSTKLVIDATTAARVIVVRYTNDSKTWKQMSFRNVAYKGPVTCTRKWQVKLHADDHYSSTCVRQFKQGKTTLDYKKSYKGTSFLAQLYFDDYLIDRIRKKVAAAKVITVPKARRIRIRYVYSGITRDVYSEWQEVKVR